MEHYLLITIPTLGNRISSLKLTLTSIQEFIPFADIEIRTPNSNLESQIANYMSIRTKVTLDDSGQALAILNSWNENPHYWCTWINDDDFALSGFVSTITLLRDYSMQKNPIIIYGDLVVMTEKETLRIRTPKRISKWLLSGGSDYIPGVLTIVNRNAIQVLTNSNLRNGLFRNSFDYQWWLELASAKSLFIHSGSCHAVWRDHVDARTKIEANFSKIESAKIKYQYTPRMLKLIFVKDLNSIIAKIVSKISSMKD